MPRWALERDGQVRLCITASRKPSAATFAEECGADPGGTVRPCPDECGEDWRWDGTAFVPPAGAPRIVNAASFRELFTMAERFAMRTAHPVLADAELRAMAQQTVNLDSNECAQLLDLAVGIGALTQERRDQVLAGHPPK